MIGLLGVLYEHADAVEADFWRFYHRDVRDLWRGTLSLRQVLVLIKHLPADSATARASDPAAQWSTAEYLLACVVDAVVEGNWLYASAHSERAPDRPRPLPRPTSSRQLDGERTFHNASDVASALNLVNAGRW